MRPIRSNTANRQVWPKGLISAEAKKLLYQNILTPWMAHNIIAYFHKYDWLCHLATLYYRYKKGGQVTKQPIKELKSFGKVTPWPQLISNLLVTPACLQCCFWLGLPFLHQVFLYSISLLFVNKYYYFIKAYNYVDAALKLNFEKLKPAIF